MRKKKLLLTIFACIAIAILALPFVTSVFNDRETTAITDSEPAIDVTPAGGGGPASAETELVSEGSTDRALNPSLFVDSWGNVHVAWEDRTNYAGDTDGDWDIFYRKYDVVLGDWTPVELVSVSSTAAARDASLAVDESGTVHIAWDDLTSLGNETLETDVFYRRFVPGSGWGSVELVSRDSTADASNPSLDVDTSGNVYVSWMDYSNYGGDNDFQPDVFYSKFLGAGWSSAVLVSTTSTVGAMNPSLAVDLSGNVHIAWEDHTPVTGAIWYRKYSPITDLWDNIEVVTEGTDIVYPPMSPSLAVDLSGNVHIAWEDCSNYGDNADEDYDIYYKEYVVSTQEWTLTELVSKESTTGAHNPSLDVDFSGNVFVAWNSYYGFCNVFADGILYSKSFAGTYEWSKPELVSTENTDDADDPSLAVDASGNLHVAWQDLTLYTGDADLLHDIVYKHFDPIVWQWKRPEGLLEMIDLPAREHIIDLDELPPHNFPPIPVPRTEVVSTDSISGAHFPSLDVDESGNVHIAWQDDTNYDYDNDNQPDIFYKKYVPGEGWGAMEIVSSDSIMGAYRPSLDVDYYGNVYVAWSDFTNYGGDADGMADIFYKKRDADTGLWINTEVISDGSGGAYNPSLAADYYLEYVDVAWHDFTTYPGDADPYADIVYKEYNPYSGWGPTYLVSSTSTMGAYNPSLAAPLLRNELYIAWEDMTPLDGDMDENSDIFFSYGGPSWSPAKLVSTGSTEDAVSPSLAVSSWPDYPNIYIAWQDYTIYGSDADLYPDIAYRMAILDGVEWFPIELVSSESTSGAYVPSLALDRRSGNVHVAWTDETPLDGSGNADIFYKQRVESSDEWETTQVWSSESTSGAYEPSLAVDNWGNVHVAWEDLTPFDGSGDYDIVYKRSGMTKHYWLSEMVSELKGLKEIKIELESKGFLFNALLSNVSRVDGGLNGTAFGGIVLSWWSSNMDQSGRMAFIVAAMMDDGHGLVFGAITNLIPPEILLAQNRYIIVNAMPYTSIEWYYYDASHGYTKTIGNNTQTTYYGNRTVKWSTWWYESQNPPDWFWTVYSNWQDYVDEYQGWNSYLPWWCWFWHYIYEKQWHNWGAQNP